MCFLVTFSEDYYLPDSINLKIIGKAVNPVNYTLWASLRHFHEMPKMYDMIPDIT